MNTNKPFSNLTIRVIVLINLAVIAVILMLPTTVYAHDCLVDPLDAADCMNSPGYKQTINIIFSTLPTLSVVIPNLIQPPGTVNPPGTQPPPTDQVPDTPPGDDPPGDEEPPEETLDYAVQVSEQYLTFNAGEYDYLSIKAYKSVNKGPWVPAPEVTISLTPSGQGFSVSPTAGAGEMQATIETQPEAQTGSGTILVRGSAGGMTTSATVHIEIIGTEYDLWTSRDSFEIAVGETVELSISANQMAVSGYMEVVNEARVHVWPPSEKDLFQWDPPGGSELYGKFTLKVTALKANQASELCFLDLKASYPDGQEIEKRVEITLLAANYKVEFL
jgi:hypothetical protein